MPRTASAIARDVLGRRAAAAADDVDEPGRGELAEHAAPCPRGSSSIVAELVRQAGIRIGADERVGDPRHARRYARASRSAPSAQFSPTETGAAWRTEFQNASGVWPDSSRPERSVMVPETITGTLDPARRALLGDGIDRGLGVERVEDGLDQQQIGAAVEQSPHLLAVGRRAVDRR